MRAFEESSGSGGRVEAAQSNAAGRNTQQCFALRAANDGWMSRLPANFQFPKITAYDLWVQWNAGNTERQTPALQSLQGGSNFTFLDGTEIDWGEKGSAREQAQRQTTST
jgi:hypothetical protein